MNEFPFDPGLPLWLCPENTHNHHDKLWSLPKRALISPPFTGINITVLVGLASLTLWLACSPGPGAAASKACHSLFPTLTAYTYFPITARSVIWHFFEGYLDFELSPPFFHRPYYHCHQPQCWPWMFPKPGKVTTLSLNLTSSADRDRQDTHIAHKMFQKNTFF